MFQSHFRERFMPKRRVPPMAMVSKVPDNTEDAQVIIVAADVHVSVEETQEPGIPKRGTSVLVELPAQVPVGQGAIPKRWMRGEQTSEHEAERVVEECPSPVVWQPPSPPPAPPIPKRWTRASSKATSSDSDSSVK